MRRTQAQETEETTTGAQEESARGRRKKISVVTREEYVEPIPENVAVATTESEPESDGDQPYDAIDALFERIEASEGDQWRIAVNRLPDYRKDGKWGTRSGARVEFCGDYPAVPEYLSLVQSEFGGGDYRFQLFENGQIRKTWMGTIARQANEQQSSGNGAKSFYITRQQTTGAPAAPSLIDELEKLKKVKDLLKDLAPEAPAPVIQNTPPEPPTIADKIQEKVIEVALAEVIKNPETDRSERLLAMALGRDTQPSWGDVLRDLAISLAPLATQLVSAYMQSVARNNSTAGQSTGLSQISTQAATAQSNADSEGRAALPAPQSVSTWTSLCRTVIKFFLAGYPIDSLVVLIDKHSERFPEDNQHIAHIVNVPEGEAAAGIAVAAGAPPEFLTNNPQFENFIIALQASLRGEEESAENVEESEEQ